MKGEEGSERTVACWNRPIVYYERATSDIIAIFEAAFGGTECVDDGSFGEQNTVTCRRTSVDKFKE